MANIIILTIRKYNSSLEKRFKTMSKAHMIVLGFLNEMPMYGYKIGQIVESKKFAVWSGIKLPSVYKAMQTLEQKNYIIGEQVVEGNNPPRTVYSLNDTGKKYLTKLILGYINSPDEIDNVFWLALSFARKIITRKQLKKAVETRTLMIKEHLNTDFTCKCEEMIKEKKIPVIHRHLLQVGNRHFQTELITMQELLEQMNDKEYDDFFKE